MFYYSYAFGINKENQERNPTAFLFLSHKPKAPKPNKKRFAHFVQAHPQFSLLFHHSGLFADFHLIYSHVQRNL
jgi:hypothetical protein